MNSQYSQYANHAPSPSPLPPPPKPATNMPIIQLPVPTSSHSHYFNLPLIYLRPTKSTIFLSTSYLRFRSLPLNIALYCKFPFNYSATFHLPSCYFVFCLHSQILRFCASLLTYPIRLPPSFPHKKCTLYCIAISCKILFV
jgi:hypothetical protein